ncbi:hypothetical protein BHE74_00045799 [Ensete ventricosum]|nr:hypothetical protein GW17_00039348 [Ensete ventricosum]RWW48145.1 hypothetical protein BHE74_00045799 [Ensete ventricosum]RZS14447.1 hypothetical protein BHM03_00046135 [Ensete ventricosum]
MVLCATVSHLYPRAVAITLGRATLPHAATYPRALCPQALSISVPLVTAIVPIDDPYRKRSRALATIDRPCRGPGRSRPPQ